MSRLDTEDILKTVKAIIRVYKPRDKESEEFPVEFAYSQDFKTTKTRKAKYSDLETDTNKELPDEKIIKADYEIQDKALADKYQSLFENSSDNYSKIIYINRSIDHDILNIKRYERAIEFYKTLISLDYKLSDKLEYQIENMTNIINLITGLQERQCQVPILFDLDAKKRIETDEWILNNRRTFMEFINKDFTKLVVSEDRATNLRYDENTRSLAPVKLFRHQQFISDFIQDKSPYRGALLFYGLGSGKTLSSINIAEGMDRQVLIFLPKSIKNNFEGDIKEKGNTLYHTQNHWCFYNVDVIAAKREQLMEMGFPVDNDELMLKLYIKRPNGDNGFWTVDKSSTNNNYENFDAIEKEEISNTVKILREQKYKFIHYNGGQGVIKTVLSQIWGKDKYDRIERLLILERFGITDPAKSLNKKQKGELKNAILEYIYNPKNGEQDPFQNKLVIIDEVHNFMSMICNGSTNGTILYEMFMRSDNCKFVALSGTPIINSPFEASVLFNLLKGYITYFNIPIKHKEGALNPVAIDKFLANYPNIDRYSINTIESSVSITRLPSGFIKNPKNQLSVINNADYKNISDEVFLETFLNKIGEIGYTKDGPIVYEKYTIFPDIFSIKNPTSRFKLAISDARDQFYDLYVDRANSKIKNDEEFLIRIMGLVSFYNEIVPEELKRGLEDDRSLFPELFYDEEKPEYVDISMTQFLPYVNVRKVEMELEDRDLTKSNVDKMVYDIESKVSQLFKVFSRQTLLFTFPGAIVRPRLKLVPCRDKDADCVETNKILEKEHENRLREVLKELDDPKYLTVHNGRESLSELSPKFTKMLENLIASPGLSFIYSQFRSLEGIEIFGLVLKNNGYEYYDSENPEKYYTNSHNFEVGNMIRYEETPDNWVSRRVALIMEDSNLLLEGFDTPVNPEKCFRARYSIWSGTESEEQRSNILTAYKSKKNMYGQVINILMTTSSGAEGINLKYVRQVHIMEPYWNKVRIDQVIGRARRIESHKDLPQNQRNVRVFEYVSRFSQDQKSGNFDKTIPGYERINKSELMSVVQRDNNKTSDETLLELTNKKYKIIHQFLTLIKRGAVDCVYNREDNIFSDPSLKTEQCLSRVPGTNVYAFDPLKLPTTRIEGVTETRIQKTIRPFEYTTIRGTIVHLLYELEIGKKLMELSDNDIAPVYNFYTYYGINPVTSDVKTTKKLIGSFRKNVDSDQIQLALDKSFLNQLDIYEKIENIILQTGEIPGFGDETGLIIWMKKIQINPVYKEITSAAVKELVEPVEEPVKKKTIRLKLAAP